MKRISRQIIKDAEARGAAKGISRTLSKLGKATDTKVPRGGTPTEKRSRMIRKISRKLGK